jgi:hypothetical protein
LDTEVELVIVRELTSVIDVRGLTLQHALLVLLAVKVGESHAEILRVPRADSVA